MSANVVNVTAAEEEEYARAEAWAAEAAAEVAGAGEYDDEFSVDDEEEYARAEAWAAEAAAEVGVAKPA